MPPEVFRSRWELEVFDGARSSTDPVSAGNPGHQRLRAEPEPLTPKDCPEPPSFITGYAADEWWSVAPELHRLRLLTRVDVASLAAYCYAYGQWRLAVEALARMADRDETMHGLLIKTIDGNARRNPLVQNRSRRATP